MSPRKLRSPRVSTSQSPHRQLPQASSPFLSTSVDTCRWPPAPQELPTWLAPTTPLLPSYTSYSRHLSPVVCRPHMLVDALPDYNTNHCRNLARRPPSPVKLQPLHDGTSRIPLHHGSFVLVFISGNSRLLEPKPDFAGTQLVGYQKNWTNFRY